MDSPLAYPRCALNRRLDGPHSQSGRVGVVKKSCPLPGIEPRFVAFLARSLVTALFRDSVKHPIQVQCDFLSYQRAFRC